MDKTQKALSDAKVAILTHGCVKESTYEVDDTFRPGPITFEGVHTITEVVALLERDKSIDFDGLFMGADSEGVKPVRLNKEKFLEAFRENGKKRGFKKMLESFDRGGGFGGGYQSNQIGQDYIPLLGGPFNKNLYLQDFLRMFALGFYAYNHDPFARALVNITVDFTLGKGFRVDSDNNEAISVWRAFEKANNLQHRFRNQARQLCYNGEIMTQWLPNNQIYFQWQDQPGQESPKGIIPRIRDIDPSTVWEIITYPEDIERVLAYQQVFPTQYQIYTTKDKDKPVPTSKFIFQQIPADQVDHYKINAASNEKRGRSDLYPVFGFLKRLRDTIQYSVVGMQKVAAWAIDTTIEGNQQDLQAYVNSMNSDSVNGDTINSAGSEFVHTAKVKREYVSNQNSHSGSVSAFEWCLNAICAAVQIPVSYLGTHLSGGSTRASALVGTEPVTKKFEARQQDYENIIRCWWDRLMKMNGIQATCEITFPELITQDRSQKMKDLIMAQEVNAISHEDMANVMAKELGFNNYDYDTVQAKIKAEKAQKAAEVPSILINPLTATAASPSSQPNDSTPKPSAVTSDEKAKIKSNDGA